MESNRKNLDQLRDKLISFDGKNKTYAITIKLDTSENNSDITHTKLKSAFQSISRDRYDFDDKIIDKILTDIKKYFEPGLYDSRAESLFFYLSVEESTKTHEVMGVVYTRLSVENYVSIDRYFDITELDIALYESERRLLVVVTENETEIYVLEQFELEKVESIENEYVELRSKDLNFVSIPSAGGTTESNLGSMHSGGQRSDPKEDLMRKYIEQIAIHIQKNYSNETFHGLHIYSLIELKNVLERSFSTLSKEFVEFKFYDHRIELEKDRDGAMKEFINELRETRKSNLTHQIASASDQGMLLNDISSIIDAVNDSKVEKLFVKAEDLGAGYLKEKIYNYPIEGSELLPSIKNALVYKVNALGGESITLPKDHETDILAIIRW